MDKELLLNELLEKAKLLEYSNKGNLNKLLKRTEMIISKIFGQESSYITKLNKFKFSPSVYYTSMSNDAYISSFNSGRKNLINLIDVMIEDVQLTNSIKGNATNPAKNNSKDIFIVHGHNEEMKQSAARLLEKLNLNPIILHELPNRGRTIIEKFHDSSDVSVAIILLSADDLAIQKNESFENAKFRARQNVILELGFFLGKLGREFVIVLYEKIENFDIPSDYQGVLFIEYQNNDSWKFSIAKELKSIGLEVDLNVLI